MKFYFYSVLPLGCLPISLQTAFFPPSDCGLHPTKAKQIQLVLSWKDVSCDTELVCLCILRCFTFAADQKQRGLRTTSRPAAQTRNLTHRRTDSSANLPPTEKSSDWSARDCGADVDKKFLFYIFFFKKSTFGFYVNARAHSNFLFFVFTSLHHNLITVMRRKANLLQAGAGPKQQNPIWTRWRSSNYSLSPRFHPVWIWP